MKIYYEAHDIETAIVKRLEDNWPNKNRTNSNPRTWKAIRNQISASRGLVNELYYNGVYTLDQELRDFVNDLDLLAAVAEERRQMYLAEVSAKAA